MADFLLKKPQKNSKIKKRYCKLDSLELNERGAGLG